MERRGAPRRAIIISDAAANGDDGCAIAMLLASPMFDVRLIVATSGNVWAEDVLANLRQITAVLGRPEIPLCLGLPARAHAARLEYYRRDAASGMKSVFAGALALSLPAGGAGGVAPEFAAAILRQRPVDLIVLGPASVAAAALRADPRLGAAIRRIYVMGGAISMAGNVTPLAEFNFWFDPVAAEALLASRIPLTLLPLDAAANTTYSASLRARLDVAFPPAVLLARRLDSRPSPVILWDEALAAAMLQPGLIVQQPELQLAVNTSAGAKYGACFVADETGRRPVQIIMAMRRDDLRRFVERSLSGAA